MNADLSLDQLVELERMEQEAAAAAAAAAAEESTGGGNADDPHHGGDRGGGGPDATVVLPWWQHPVNILTLVVTAAILSAMIGWMVGDNGSQVEHSDVDTGFLQDMRVHHEQAVLMGVIYRNLPDTDPGLRTVARSIVNGQSIEIGRMIQLLRSFGEPEANQGGTSMVWMGMSADTAAMPGMASDDQLDELGRLDGRSADELFVQLMTAHHLGGVDMAEFAAANAANGEVRLMAQSMASAQIAEIREMADLLG